MSSNFADDSLGEVANMEGKSSRATTPQMRRTTPRRQRHGTPQRAGSAPRASSAGKVSALAKACFESQSCNRSLSRNAGRRKQQKWENDNLFGLNMFMKKVHALNKQDDVESDDESGEENEISRQGFKLNWKSLFGTISNGENEEALNAYLMCSNSYRASSGQSKSIKDCVSEWDRAEFSWMKMEKRLRTIILRALVRREAQKFVAAVEDLLLNLELSSTDSSSKEMSSRAAASVQHLFLKPPRVVRPSSRTSSRENKDGDEVLVNVASNQLILTLVDSSFHRLLLHATCQFHNMHSKSFSDKKNGGVRATRIAPYQTKKCRHTISLVPFVLLKVSSEGPRQSDGGKENRLSNLASDDVIDLSDLKLEEKSSKSVCTDGSKPEQSHSQAELSDDDDDEYFLVDFAGSRRRSNPIESREEA